MPMRAAPQKCILFYLVRGEDARFGGAGRQNLAIPPPAHTIPCADGGFAHKPFIKGTTMAATRQTTAPLQQDLAARRQQHAQQQPLVEQFLAIYLESPHRVLDAIALVEEGRIELFRHGETVGAVIAEPGLEGVPASYRILQQDHCHCTEAQQWPPHPCGHLLALALVDALAQQAAHASAADAPVL
jgi:hypothetical protein